MPSRGTLADRREFAAGGCPANSQDVLPDAPLKYTSNSQVSDATDLISTDAAVPTGA
jgi:hypothetical protein